MKLRLRGNSVRLRLTRGEVAALQQRGSVGETTAFPGGRAFNYRIVSADQAGDCEAQFDGTTLTVRVPAAVVADWSESDAVSIEATQDLGAGAALRILVEKDFACLADRPGEDDSDAYPHPDRA